MDTKHIKIWIEQHLMRQNVEKKPTKVIKQWLNDGLQNDVCEFVLHCENGLILTSQSLVYFFD